MARAVTDAASRLQRLGLRGRTVVVLGLGKTGVVVAGALERAGARVLASDRREEVPEAAALSDSGVDVELGGHDRAMEWVEEADLVVPSPGIPPHAPPLARALEAEVPVASEIEVASRLCDAPVVAVTGTNGKTTTCRLVGAVLLADGRDAVVCGNIGEPFLEAVVERPAAEVFVVEVSSFQLFFCSAFHPRVAVITNIAPDHLDWHGSMDAYRRAKGRIAARQGPSDAFVHPAGSDEIAELAPQGGPRRLAFGPDPVAGEGVWAEGEALVARLGGREERFGSLGALAARGGPFVEDGLAAAAAALDLGADPDAVGRALAGFVPDHHRVEPVGERGGVRFVDDSKATNPHAAAAALRTFDGVVLIAGGRNKGLDLSPMAAEPGRLRAVVAIGEAADDVARAFAGSGVPVERAGEMDDAVRRAHAAASPGGVVLLSPGCSSWDAYESYAQRGRAFREAVEGLPEDA